MITEKQKKQIVELRAVGTSFQKIADELKICKPPNYRQLEKWNIS